ncbi:(2Fe-2S)-binding protein [Methylomarinum vadi]|uniref:(2Fe-2S)-binding protein n=1 Tax=Methylomarinum vadi TaxID=438855 RepID=UPI0004DF7E17|nr:(2Fe-2S)-binding protein [Methylomarinum vadi]
MNPSNREEEQEVICDCSGTTAAKIKQLIDQGVDNLERISRITGACSGCGSCDSTVMELLEEHAKSDCGTH